MKKPDPREGRHLEDPRTGNELLDPLPEDQGSATGRLSMTISKTRCRTMWPPDGGET